MELEQNHELEKQVLKRKIDDLLDENKALRVAVIIVAKASQKTKDHLNAMCDICEDLRLELIEIKKSTEQIAEKLIKANQEKELDAKRKKHEEDL